MAMKVQGGRMVPTYDPNTRMARENARKAFNVSLYSLRNVSELSGVGMTEAERRKLAQVVRLMSELSSSLDANIPGSFPANMAR